MGIRIEQTTCDAIPTGDYRAVITGIEAVEGKFGPQLQIKCEISAGPHAANTFLCWVSTRFSPRSRLYEWVEAALAMPVPRAQPLVPFPLKCAFRRLIRAPVRGPRRCGGTVHRPCRAPAPFSRQCNADGRGAGFHRRVSFEVCNEAAFRGGLDSFSHRAQLLTTLVSPARCLPLVPPQ